MMTFKEFLNEGDVVQFPKIKKQNELEKILSSGIKGNAYHDRDLMQRIHNFVADKSNPMEDRIKALKKLDDVMGVQGTKVTANDVESYLRNSEK